MHLDGGAGVLAPELVTAMQQPQIQLPDPWTLGTHWGLGWILFDWDDRRVYGHDGNSFGQAAFLRVVPDRQVAIALLVNGGHPDGLFHDLYSELLREVADLTMPSRPQPPADPPDLGAHRFTGVYDRVGVQTTIRPGEQAGTLACTLKATGELADLHEAPIHFTLVPFTTMDNGAVAFLGQFPGETSWTPAVFYRLGERQYLHMGARATPRIEA
jgi:hypothetical protein